MSISAASDSCTVCQKQVPRPVLTCFDCSEGVDIHGTTRPEAYCTSLCRNTERQAHRVECEKRNTRKHIYRAGDLLQAIFFLMRDRNFDAKITRLEKKNGFLRFYNSDTYKADEIFQTSPYKTLPNVKDAHAVMSYYQCDMALTCLYQLSKKLFNGVAKYIEEAAFNMGPSLYKLQMVFELHHNGAVYEGAYEAFASHQVLCVETHGGESYGIDLTGAQFGQYKSVLPLKEIIGFYGDKVPIVWPHGHYYVDTMAALKTDLAETDGGTRRGHLSQAYFASLFNKRMNRWTSDQGITIEALLVSTRKEYEEFKSKVLSMVINGINEGAPIVKQDPDLKKMLRALELPESIVKLLNTSLTPAIMKDYPGSQIGKVCVDHLMELVKQGDLAD